MPDHYTYPGTEVLVNIPGYTDPATWKEAETAVIGMHARELTLHPIPGAFDLAHLQAVHARLVDGFYTWGGLLRDTDTGPGGTGIAHCRPEFIPAQAEALFAVLADADYLRGRDRDRFSAGLAKIWGELTAIHPFRDVNTRSQFVFFNQLAEHAGWFIDWHRIDPQDFAHARTLAIVQDESGIEALLHEALIPADQIEHAELRARMERVTEDFTRPRPPRSVRELDERLRAARLRRRETFLSPLDDPFSHDDRPEPRTPGRGL